MMNREIAKQRAMELVKQMTVEEMASQLRYDAPAIPRLQIPEYNWWNESLHGVARAGTATVFPQAIGLGATFDKDLLFEIGEVIAEEGRAKYNESAKNGDRDIYKGLTFWAPNVNIFRDPRWGRGHETYGEDPKLTSELGVSFIKGLQGEGPYRKAAACAKHFAVHSGPEAERHFFDAKTSMKDLFETYLPAFEACVKEADVEAVMGAYNRTNGEPCCAHKFLMEEVLRERWKFEGHFVSDCWAVRDFHEEHRITKTPEESAALALNTGCDLNCGCTYQKLLDAYKKGKVKKETIETSAIRLFTTRFLLGMFDQTEYDQIPYSVVESKEHLALSEKAAEESLVLLKNNGILPLDPNKKMTIGVIGPNADSRKALMGNYYGTSSRYTTCLQGIQQVAGEAVRVLYSEGCHLFLEKPDHLSRPLHRLSEAKTVAQNSDLVILCLGLDETLEGEEGDTGNSDASGDKRDLKFPLPQQKLLEAVIETKVPFIVCVMTGSAMDLNLCQEHAEAILQTWYPGALGGKVIADVLFGQRNPSGKLPVTFYKDLSDLPDFKDYSMKKRTYRYLETKPLYPFGYGLIYGKAEIEKVWMDSEVIFKDTTENGLKICALVKNQSDIALEEVVQVYVRVTGTEFEVSNHKLAGFSRVRLQAGEEKVVELTLSKQSFAVIDDNGNVVFEGNGANIYVGFGQPDERTFELTGSKVITIELS